MIQYTIRLQRSGRAGSVFVVRDTFAMKLATWHVKTRELRFLSPKPCPFLDTDDLVNIQSVFIELPVDEPRDIGSFQVELSPQSDRKDPSEGLISLSIQGPKHSQFREDLSRIGTWTPVRGIILHSEVHPIFKRDRKHLANECSIRHQKTRGHLGIFGENEPDPPWIQSQK